MLKVMIGPNLTNYGNRRMLAAGTLPNTEEGMHEWLRDSVDSNLLTKTSSLVV